MKKKRALPYGYTVQSGKRVVAENEAAAIQHIFTAYRAGATMSELAIRMTKMNVPYCEKRMDWNKNIIARILADPRYVGEGGYEPLISKELFHAVNSAKAERTKQQPVPPDSSFTVLRRKVLCGACGSPMTRSYEKRLREPVSWKCTCQDCRSRIALADDLLENKIVERMNSIIAAPELLEDEDAYRMDSEEPIQRAKVTAELSRMCESGNYSDEQLLAMILENAQKRYALCPEDRSSEAALVAMAYSEAAPTQALNTDLFQKTVKHILLSADGEIHLRLISGKEI